MPVAAAAAAGFSHRRRLLHLLPVPVVAHRPSQLHLRRPLRAPPTAAAAIVAVTAPEAATLPSEAAGRCGAAAAAERGAESCRSQGESTASSLELCTPTGTTTPTTASAVARVESRALQEAELSPESRVETRAALQTVAAVCCCCCCLLVLEVSHC